MGLMGQTYTYLNGRPAQPEIVFLDAAALKSTAAEIPAVKTFLLSTLDLSFEITATVPSSFPSAATSPFHLMLPANPPWLLGSTWVD